MALTVAKYTFSSWLRKGIAVNINDADHLGAGTSTPKERATVPIDVLVNGAGVHKDFTLLGPGDIIGINPQMVVRTAPRHWITNFEPNYLTFIEFYDEDFAWRYTPAKANGDKLRPWMALLVLEDNEKEEMREFIKNDKKFPLPTVIVKSAATLPPAKELWAWAHVHTNDGYANSSEFEKFLQSLHRPEDPQADKIICRLMSPRNLKPNTGYRAFVVPSFETGRLAGLGLDPKDVEAQKSAWTESSDNIELPIYYEWYFRTGEDQDFESLVKLLDPIPMDKRVGIREMNGSKPGFGMTEGTDIGNLAEPEWVATTIGLEGALKAPTTRSRPETLDLTKPFFDELQDILNFPAKVQAIGGSDAEDPVISPPIYGENHALTYEVDINNNGWMHALNRDPRNRVPAGFGTNVIQKNQETYVARAWEQVKKVLDANKKILYTMVSLQFSKKAVNKFLAKLPASKALVYLGPLLKKVKGSPTTLHFQMQESYVPTAAVSTAFRKIIRPRGPYFKKLDDENARFSHEQLLNDLNDRKISPAFPKEPPKDIITIDDMADKHPADTIPSWKKFLLRNAMLLLIVLMIVLLLVAVLTGGWIFSLVIAGAAFAWYMTTKKEQHAFQMTEGFTDPSKMTSALQAITPPKNFELVITGETLPVAASGTVVKEVSQQTSTSPNAVTYTTNNYATTVAGAQTTLEAENFRKAAIAMSRRLSIRPPEKRLQPFNIINAHNKLMSAVDPQLAFPKLLASSVQFTFNPAWLTIVEHLVPAMAYPDFEDPMYEKLRDISSELLIPNLNLIPPNSISLMVTNPPFIESYMLGLNHEFGRELLWREYPTDKRGSYFRQFWDVKGMVTNYSNKKPEELVDDFKDITPVDTWPSASELGTHKKIKPPGKQVVLVVRGELLKKYPNTIIYAQKAHMKSRDGKQRSDKEPVIWEVETTSEMQTEIQFPLFKAEIDPDLRFFGFNLTVEQARGHENPQQETDDWGWYFVIQEVPGEPKFGMDIYFESDNDPTTPLTWDDLAWSPHFDEGLPFVSTTIKPQNFTPAGTDSLDQWGLHSANMAYILYQKPVMIAVHASEMLDKL